jgi:hypothetical protein
VAWAVRRRERVLPAALAGTAMLWIYALAAGTPYQEAKALVLLAPLVALVTVRALLEAAPSVAEVRRILARRSPLLLLPGRARQSRIDLAVGALGVAVLAAAGGSSLLALVNGPVGPSGYSPELAELRPTLGDGSTLVLAPEELLDEQHGRDYIVWELRGNRICVAILGDLDDYPSGQPRTVGVLLNHEGAVAPARVVPSGSGASASECPFIPDGARADPAGDD